ncbi:carboxypeptidase-like regulatory domain-containing protein [Flavobacterium sp.]|uniref:carboxypeptidase-like regulatory domain-containing protein n=1 Tax=Flavobacterium sp. TaxID=239 RepID=UPI003D130D7E
MCLRIRILLLTLSFPLLVFGQKKITGVVKDLNGNLISSASITIQDMEIGTVIAYGISDTNGQYNVTFNSLKPALNLKIKAFNFKAQEKKIENNNHKIDFSLETEVIEIKEIKLKTQLITKRGDTISYNLNAFDNKSDRTLSDVLKKIPGINVNPDGSILYQGTLINKFYVNGKDLMEGSYGTINNSLPKDDVLKVEVLENHQPVKILQENVISEQAAVNIKLKKKVSITGRGELSSGYSNTFLWNAKLTPMFFGQKNQWVLNYKTNNLGESVEKEEKLLSFGSTWEGKRIQTLQNEWLSTENAILPNLPEKRYLLNKVHYFSANLLTNPFKNKEWEVKVNSNYSNNEIIRDSRADIFYFQPYNQIINTISNKFYSNKLKSELIIIKNAKKGFFKNITTYSRFWNIQQANTLLNALTANQSMAAPTLAIQNSLSAIVPWKQKMLNIKSYLNYQTDNQTLKIEPKQYVFNLSNLIDSNIIKQNFEIKTFQSEHSINLGFTKNAWTFTPEVGIAYRINTMSSNLEAIDQSKANTTDFSNQIKYTYFNPYAGVEINFKKNSWMLFFKFPFNLNSIGTEDFIKNTSKSFSKVTFEPLLYAQYSFASHWKTSIQSNISYNFGDINTLFSGNILQNPLSLSRMNSNNVLQESINKNLNLKLEYRDPFTNLFFNAGNRYVHINRNSILNNTITNGIRETTFDYTSNTAFSNTLYGEIGKYFPKFKTNTAINIGNTWSNDQQKISGLLKDIQTFNQNISFKLNSTFFNWMSIDYNFSYKWIQQLGVNINQLSTNALANKLNISLYPLENHTVALDYDQLNSSNTVNSQRNAFFDLSYQFAYSKKKIDFELKWQNFTNTSVFELYDLSTFYQSYSKINLRPSQITFAVKFNFK